MTVEEKPCNFPRQRENTTSHKRLLKCPVWAVDRQTSWDSLGLPVTRKESNMEVLIDLVSPTEGLREDLRRCESVLVRSISGSWILYESRSERAVWIIARFQKRGTK